MKERCLTSNINVSTVMLRIVRPSDQTPLPKHEHALLVRLSLSKYLPTRSPITRFTAPCGRQPAHSAFAAVGNLPLHALNYATRPLLLPIARPTRASRSLLPQSHAVGRAARLCYAIGAVARDPCWWYSRAATPRPKSIGPGLSLPLCCKYMFQVF
jgi:hypothetical protein